jgi:hypothetical protein
MRPAVPIATPAIADPTPSLIATLCDAAPLFTLQVEPSVQVCPFGVVAALEEALPFSCV